VIETISGFDWDDRTSRNARRHGVSIEEIERPFRRPHTIRVDLEHSLGEERLRAIGRSNEGRYVLLVFTIRERNGEHLIRSISARYMHREEVEYYEKENPDLQDQADSLPSRCIGTL
jgi:uncharacterized DUF497 family protein